uniref:Uncharacterized protein n=1 Tax=Arundo donax TaxID=35708 RepID=A0A0A9AMW5_ARUDO
MYCVHASISTGTTTHERHGRHGASPPAVGRPRGRHRLAHRRLLHAQ